ncbi:unnamed protein product [Rhizophagus irregularis]|uniref:Actin-like ATPase domain-containing protein n=1 Tax=Rhizophagus irregularis TaxID=588596 RepID=A0A2I1HCQ7_9GLOM|nr:actin-like ATPase domain-containing protein [Rhizophagus irregularis]CAB4434687.1 unnamed protein product [Rhizophagus irregularis]
MSWKSDVRVVVGIDFGTTYSGFAYRFTDFAGEIHTNKDWEGYVGKYKTNTVLEYDDNFKNVVKWGRPAFIKGTTNEADDTNEPKSVGLFKLHLGSLGKLQDHLKPKIPVEFKKAIIDYLREMGKLIKKTVESVEGIKFHENVLLVLSVPAEYSKKELAIMRECASEADLIKEENSEYLQFTTEPEAAAIYCMKNCLESYEIGTTFMIVDCGGGTVDLTTRKLVGENQLGEITERAGDYCGSSFIDEAFLKYIGSIVGNSTIDKLRDKKSKSLQRMVDHFCRKAKFPFTGEDTDFQYDLDVLDVIKVLKKFVNDEAKELLEKNGWSIEIEFEEIKSMFDPIVEKIIQMIGTQLDNCRDECSIIFLVGGFGQSKYLKNRIEEKFKDRVKSIVVSKEPVAAVVRGATLFGLSLYDKIYNMRNDEDVVFVLKNRKLNFTYGIKVFKPFRKGDPPERKTSNGFIQRFHRIAKRDDIVDIDSEIRIYNLCPVSGFQTFATFYIYITKEYDPKYCDGMEVLGTLKIDLSNNGTDRRVSFALSFGQMELLTATARNETDGQNYLATFEINKEIGIV